MRASRLIPALTALLGAGLVSGSLAQVASLDGDLERAAAQQQRDVLERVERRQAARHLQIKRCEREQRTQWRAS